MSITFNADEVFEMALQMETDGAAFYRAAAEGRSGRTRDFLSGLASMEENHRTLFGEMKEQLADRDRAASLYDPEGEAARYLRAFAEGKVFSARSGHGEFLRAAKSLDEILSFAIGLEKESIVFYVGIKELVADAAGKEKLEKIIHEEMGHVTALGTWIE